MDLRGKFGGWHPFLMVAPFSYEFQKYVDQDGMRKYNAKKTDAQITKIPEYPFCVEVWVPYEDYGTVGCWRTLREPDGATDRPV